ncbi:unnamed protein product, partial [marine sediment metagenome]
MNNAIIEKLKAGSLHFAETIWPGTEERILLRILNAQDYSEILIGVENIFKNIVMTTSNVDDYNAERETWMLFHSISDVATKTRLFPNVSELRKCLTPEIKEILAEELDALHD